MTISWQDYATEQLGLKLSPLDDAFPASQVEKQKVTWIWWISRQIIPLHWTWVNAGFFSIPPLKAADLTWYSICCAHAFMANQAHTARWKMTAEACPSYVYPAMQFGQLCQPGQVARFSCKNCLKLCLCPLPL